MGQTWLPPILLLLLSPPCLASSPGAPWTEADALTVKAKLNLTLTSPVSVVNEYLRIYTDTVRPDGYLLPNAPRLLRLGFHDCLPHIGSGGGCNGCLNPTHMGKVADCTEHYSNPDVKYTDNNGLQFVADILEEIFTNGRFPTGAMGLETSLAGKNDDSL